jgi:hypothetical protein
MKWKNETYRNYSRSGGGGIKENNDGMNLIKIYCKHFYKCQNVSSVQQYYDSKNKFIKHLIKKSQNRTEKKPKL